MIGGLIEKLRLRAWRVTVPMRSITRRSDRSQARFDSFTRGG